MITPIQSGPKKCFFLNSLSFGLRNLCNDQRGTIAVISALSATALVGFAALAIDVASWQVAQRSMQGAADAAAYSAGIAYNAGLVTPAEIVTQAEGITAANGYVGGASALNSTGVQNMATLVTVTVNQPPKSGPNTGNATAIEVIIQQPRPRFLAGLFLSSDPTVNARAVAKMLSPPCLLALDPTASQAITVSGGANLNSAKCDVEANSNSANAINMNGSSTITTPCLIAVGNVNVTSGLDLTQCTSPTTGAAAAADPYASVPEPTPSGPCLNPVTSGNTSTFSPGYYCGNIKLTGSARATFQPGVYYVNGNFAISGSATASGTGVTFFITAPNSVTLTGNQAVNFTAPTSGTYSGIVFFGDRNGVASSNNTFAGGSTETITGVIYFPTQGVTYTGGSASSSDCTQIVADTIKVTGTSYFSSSCIGDGMVTNTVHLVE